MRHKLRQLRQQKGISQTHIAKQLGFKYSSGYNNIEMGRNRMSLEQAYTIASILGVTVDDLNEGDNFFGENLHIKCKTSA